MLVFSKAEIKENLTEDNIFDLLEEFGGDPLRVSFGILSHTICHNLPGEGSMKLYYYNNSQLFTCYTGCPESYFDVFELVIKVMYLQYNKHFDLNDAVRWVAQRFGFTGYEQEYGIAWDEGNETEEAIPEKQEISKVTLKEYDKSILDRFNYEVILEPWRKENIAQDVLDKARIGFYPGDDKITIPHFDEDNRLVGLRGRTMVKEEALLYGKYRPLRINGIIYSHPVGMNLYGLNWSKNNIAHTKQVIVFESEKSVLKFASYFGWENNTSVAICGSNMSSYQMWLLKSLGIEEMIIAFDRQFIDFEDDECKQWQKKLYKLKEKFKDEVDRITFLWDTDNKLGYKDSPIDKDKETFLYLCKNRREFY